MTKEKALIFWKKKVAKGALGEKVNLQGEAEHQLKGSS